MEKYKYKIKELKINTMYTCRISNRPVLIVNIKEETLKTPEGLIDSYVVEGRVYNHVSGRYESLYPYDNQLGNYYEKNK